MKPFKIVILAIFFFSSMYNTFGQGIVLEVQKAPFQYLSDRGTPVLVTDTYFETDTSYEVTLPYAITYQGNTYNKVWLTSRGQIAFSNPESGYPIEVISPFESNFQASLSEDPKSTVSYMVMGKAPERIIAFEWRDYYFKGLDGVFDHINMQAWVYEKGEKIEFRYGYSETELMYPNYLEDSIGHFGGVLGVGSILAKDTYEGNWFFGDSVSPQIINVIRDDEKVGKYRLGFPPDSTVFVITPENPLSSSEPIQGVSITFSRPSTHLITLDIVAKETINTSYYLYDINGHLYQRGFVKEPKVSIDVSKLEAGIYQISVPLRNGNIWSHKFYKAK